MNKFISKKGLRFLTLFIGLLGPNVNVKAQDNNDCTIFQNALKVFDNTNSNLGNCCSTKMVKCVNNNITEIKLEDKFCSGNGNQVDQFISKINSLENLTSFEFINGNLCKSLPKKFPELKNLKTLVYRGNNATSIPENISELTNLETLDFSENNIKGEIPLFIGELKNLKSLKLNNNDFSGYIPYNFENFESLNYLNLKNNNNLKGYVPRIRYLKDCDFDATNLCKTEETTCSINLSKKCSDDEIEATNSNNHNPDINFGNMDIIILKGGMLLFYFIIIIMIVGCIFCLCCCVKAGKKQKEPKQKPVQINVKNANHQNTSIIDVNSSANNSSSDINSQNNKSSYITGTQPGVKIVQDFIPSCPPQTLYISQSSYVPTAPSNCVNQPQNISYSIYPQVPQQTTYLPYNSNQESQHQPPPAYSTLDRNN